MDYRSDGLLRGSREERARDAAVSSEVWDLDFLLGAHIGLLDHAEEVRGAALLSLIKTAARSNNAFQVSPFDMIHRFISPGNWTVSSGLIFDFFGALIAMKKKEADQIANGIVIAKGKEHLFEDFLNIMLKKGRKDLIEKIDKETLSTKRRETFRNFKKSQQLSETEATAERKEGGN